MVTLDEVTMARSVSYQEICRRLEEATSGMDCVEIYLSQASGALFVGFGNEPLPPPVFKKYSSKGNAIYTYPNAPYELRIGHSEYYVGSSGSTSSANDVEAVRQLLGLNVLAINLLEGTSNLRIIFEGEIIFAVTSCNPETRSAVNFEIDDEHNAWTLWMPDRSCYDATVTGDYVFHEPLTLHSARIED